ncbi:lipase [Bifidobacterium castoris]|uniref:Lipase n=2 Tax=Bifidobacterium castoris TaxID=2306972 RepID=A0A430F8L3_9BIFI|nr:lipase [Bifidobacterium castoris]
MNAKARTSMNPFEKVMATIEGAWAKRHVHLMPEPPGERVGDAFAHADAEPSAETRPASDDDTLKLIVVGDSMVAGCGVPEQSQGFPAQLARAMAKASGRHVHWAAYGKLGATMRRVRYRLLPQVKADGGRADILVLCAGSNDIMAMRSGKEWEADLRAAVAEAKQLADHVVTLSSGQPHNSPVLGNALKKALRIRIADQTRISRHVCADEHVPYIALAFAPIGDPKVFWSHDGFHPSARGYAVMVGYIVSAMRRNGLL